MTRVRSMRLFASAFPETPLASTSEKKRSRISLSAPVLFWICTSAVPRFSRNCYFSFTVSMPDSGLLID